MDKLILLIINLAASIWLIYFSYWFIGYNIKWWLRVNRSKNILNNHFKKKVLLEIKVPREVYKSPAAMEIFLGSIAAQSLGHSVKPLIQKANEDSIIKKTKKKYDKLGFEWLGDVLKYWSLWWFELRKYWQDKYIKGSVRGWFSLEIISEEGKIRFFLHTYDKHVDLQRNTLYAQYPGIEITEVEDYTLNHHYKPGGDLDVYFGKWSLKKSDYLPIKTYIDYGMDKDPKEEFKVDPLQGLLETMSMAGKGEHFWFQILLRPTIKDDWRKESQAKIDELLKVKVYTKDDIEVKEGKRKEGEKEQRGSLLNLSPKDKKEVEIITRNLEKDGFDCFVRMLGLKYKDPNSKFSVSKNVLPIVYAMKPFDSVGYNAFQFDTITTDSDYPTLDPKSLWTNKRRADAWEAYVLRNGFYVDAEPLPYSLRWQWNTYWYRRNAIPTKEWANSFKNFVINEYYGVPEIHAGQMGEFVLNTEEVATLFHIPSKIQGTSSNVINSVKSDPPFNLPM